MNTPTPTVKGRKPLTIKYPKGAFTVDQLFALNAKAEGKGNVKCELTARNHIQRGLANGKLIKLAEKVATGKAGAPAFKFQLKAAADYNAARRAAKAAKAAQPVAPVVEAVNA